MIKLVLIVALTSTVLLAPMSARAQAASTPQDAGQQFAQLNQMLSGTADSLLAAATQSSTATVSQLPTRQPAVDIESLQVGHLRAAVERVRKLRPIIDPILRQEGIPPELTAVVLVESGGQMTALSPKGARGLWQFMPDTARRYGLVVSAERDERLDILKSTRAAARYLHDLYSEFGSWQLALAAYNAGEQVVQSALQRTGDATFDSLNRRRILPEETRKYVPAVLAAMHWFGGPVETVSKARVRGRVLFAHLDSTNRSDAVSRTGSESE